MIRALMWKEYREHRAIWVTLALGGSAGLYGLSQLLGPVWGLSYHSARESLQSLAVLLAWTYGLICGAMLLANEAETGTLTFLDMLPVRRLEVWLVKALFGLLLLLAQVAVLIGFVIGLGITETVPQLLGTLLAMLAVGLFAMSWSLLFSARGENVLNVIGLSFVGQIGGILAASLLFVGFVIAVALLGGRDSHATRFLFSCFAFLGLTLGPLVGSARLFTRLDRARGRSAPLIPRQPEEPSLRASWGRLLWLGYAQMRRLLLGVLLFALAMGFLMLIAGPITWPSLTLFLGVLCGVTVWSDEQLSASFRFLGDQRLPLGRVWIVKIGLRFALAVAAAFVLLLPSLVVAFVHHLETNSTSERMPFFADVLHSVLVGTIVPIGIHLWLWLLYGFSTGQLCGMLFRKSLVAGVVALGTAGLLVCLWVPSLLGIGLHFWQVAGVPLALLVAGYLLMPAWAADRLLGRDTLLRLGSALLVAGLWTVGGLWYRVAEIPNIPDQLDMPEFVAGIPPQDKGKNPAGMAIRYAWPLVHARCQELYRKRNGERLFPNLGVGKGDTFSLQIDAALKEGWPKRSSELGEWLDDAFQQEWYEQLAEATNHPLGAVENLKQMTFNDPLQPWHNAADITRVLAARGLQQQVRGDPRTFVTNLNISLALARNLQHYAPPKAVEWGWLAERIALAAIDRWLEKLSDHPELLERMRDLLFEHESQLPDDRHAIKSAYLIARNSLDSVPDKLIAVQLARATHRANSFGMPASEERLQAEIDATALFWRIPWEYARHERILRLAFQEPVPFSEAARRQLIRTHKWGGDALTILMPLRPQPRDRRDLALLHASQLKVALRLYQAKNHGNLPPALDDLLPGYVPSIPLDPFDGKPFRYRISAGEQLEWSTHEALPRGRGGAAVARGNAPPGMNLAPPPPRGPFLPPGMVISRKEVPAGQAILWSVGEDEHDDGGKRQGLQDAPQDHGAGFYDKVDLIYLVPPP